MNKHLLGAALALSLASATVFAANAFYLGNWKIVSASIAPWADPARKPDPAEMKSLVGKPVTITPAGITGPHAVACKGPKYQVREYPADMLFQGAFDEMHRRDASMDPNKLAAKVGFTGAKSWKTLETGCGNEIDFHFINPSTAAFGLNDYVYMLKKE